MIGAPAPFRIDLEHGGRWTSLHLGGREWLWRRPDSARAGVAPGDRFVDAGGIEECVPTVRGMPDHGAAWSRQWQRVGDEDVVDCAYFVLRRRIRAQADGVIATYRLAAEPGYRFVWAAHALLDLGVGARIQLTEGAEVRLYREAGPLIDLAWPAGAEYVVGAWPSPGGLPLSELGPDDGTAVGATVVDAGEVDIVDGDRCLTMRVDADLDIPVSVSIWRNLGGFPAGTPYRSVGVEPMLGRVFDLATAGDGDAVVVPGSGEVDWILRLGSS